MLKRTHIHLSEEQIERIQKLADKKGIKFAEVVRRILDRGLNLKEFKIDDKS